MKKITVTASKTYDISIGTDILDRAGSYIRQAVGGNVTAVITDDIVAGLYGQRLTNTLADSGYRVITHVIPNGESSKTPENFFAILNLLAQEKLSRTDVVVALGGGVVGDLAGFAAACYMRGVRFVQIPTTLLAAIDSSVGGKTAVNLHAGKNLAGAFYQPDAVLCDVSLLSTLTDEVFAGGCAEVIKYGMLASKELFELLCRGDRPRSPALTKHPSAFDGYIDIIARCVEIKRDIVNEDERENGVRKLLNYGHTVGHAIEKLSGYSISHGHAVAAGMAIEARAAVKMNLCAPGCLDELLTMLRLYNLPESTEYSAGSLTDICLSDKKRAGDKLTMIFPVEIGKCVLHDIPVSDLQSVIQLGLDV